MNPCVSCNIQHQTIKQLIQLLKDEVNGSCNPTPSYEGKAENREGKAENCEGMAENCEGMAENCEGMAESC